MGFIRINNRKNFLIGQVPQLHPESLSYINYWKRHKRRCIEGFWSKDDSSVTIDVNNDIDDKILSSQGNWRFCVPNLYFYVNYGVIKHQDENGPKSAPKKKKRPDLRDVEWEFFYNWFEARGFSGFKDDNEFSCNRDLISIKLLKDLSLSCFTKEGEVKKYVPAREYLRILHDKPLGIPVYDNEARNLFMLGSRGFGKSYMVGVGVILHELLFDGAKEYTQESIKDPYTVEIFVGAALSSKSAEILEKTEDALANMKGGWGEGTERYVPPPFSKIMRS